MSNYTHRKDTCRGMLFLIVTTHVSGILAVCHLLTGFGEKAHCEAVLNGFVAILITPGVPKAAR